jgi:hypothetical protein
MKNLYILPLILFSFLAKAQKYSHTFSTSYGTGNGKIKMVLGIAESDWGYYTGKSVNTVGLNYFGGINNHLFIETGLILLHHQFTKTTYHPRTTPTGADLKTTTDVSLNVITIPLKLRVEFAKYFFISGGIMRDFPLGKTAKSYIHPNAFGVGIGGGVQYLHHNKFGIFIYPQANIHELFESGIVETNVTFGLAYRIPRR